MKGERRNPGGPLPGAAEGLHPVKAAGLCALRAGGGRPGAKGRNILVHRNGTSENLGGKVERVVKAGELVIIKTPGGGGFGQR